MTSSLANNLSTQQLFVEVSVEEEEIKQANTNQWVQSLNGWIIAKSTLQISWVGVLFYQARLPSCIKKCPIWPNLMIDAYQSDWDSTFSWLVYWYSPAWYSPPALSLQTCTMMHEWMLISILTQSLINCYTFKLYVHNLTGWLAGCKRFMNSINELITNDSKSLFLRPCLIT